MGPRPSLHCDQSEASTDPSDQSEASTAPWCHPTCGQCLDIGGESANTEMKYWQATMEIRLTAQNPVPKVLLKRYLNIRIIIILFIIPWVQAFQFLVLALAFLAPTIMESRH